MLWPQPIGSIPDDTLLAGKAAIPGGNACIKLRDHLGTIFHDSLLARSSRGEVNLQPHLGVWLW